MMHKPAFFAPSGFCNIFDPSEQKGEAVEQTAPFHSIKHKAHDDNNSLFTTQVGS